MRAETVRIPRDAATLVGFVGQDPERQAVCDTVFAEIAFGLEAVGVEALPGEAHEAQTLEDAVKPGTLGQSADVVQASVEADAVPTVALEAAAWNAVTFQYRDTLAFLRQ